MKIFTSAQIHELDKYTIEHEPISSIDLMERASKAITSAIMDEWQNSTPVVVFAGPGNNGGDALAVARMLAEENFKVSVYLFNIHGKLSPDCEKNKQRLLNAKKIELFTEITANLDPPQLTSDTLVIDGLFGSGINKPLSGGFAAMVKYINQCPSQVIAIDIPSGLMCEDNTSNIRQNIIKADLTLTLGQKKLAMLFADNQPYIGRLKVLDIGLSKDYIEKTETKYNILERRDIANMLNLRSDYAHKGSMGNAILFAGCYGMAGAAILSAKACLRSGVGKLTVHTPKRNNDILQISVPEAVIEHDRSDEYFATPVDTNDFSAMGIGPGLGQNENTASAMITQIRQTLCPIVVDADAINVLANHRAWLQRIPKDIIFTPHPKEFDRLNGGHSSGCYERLHKAQQLAIQLQAYIILKGHNSALCMPDGMVIFNPTGNSGMATAGSGDVLTGIITAFLARGYSHAEACMLGMYIHGLAGDLACEDTGKESLIASDIIDYLPKAFKLLEKS